MNFVSFRAREWFHSHCISKGGFKFWKVTVVLQMSCLCVFAQTGIQAWQQRYSSKTEVEDWATDLAVDSDGDVVVIGYTETGRTGPDMLVIKYSSSGAPLWTNRFNGLGDTSDYARSVAIGTQGNVYVAGDSTTELVTLAFSSAGAPLWTNRYSGMISACAIAVSSNGTVCVTGSLRVNRTNNNFLTIAYSSSGVGLWTNELNLVAYDYPQAMAVGHDGTVYVTGNSQEANNYNYITVAYSQAGIPLWTNRFGGQGSSVPRAIATGDNGNVFVTGYFSGSGGPDFATIAYSHAGIPLWTNRYNGPNNSSDVALALAVGGNGNIYVGGQSFAGSGNAAYVTIAYSNTGNPLWTNRHGIGSGHISDLTVDAANNVYITGASTTNYATVAYSGDGNPLWTNRYGAGIGDDAKAVAVTSNGIVYVTGVSLGAERARDIATVAYSTSGGSLWTNRYSKTGFRAAEARAVAVAADGTVYVTGDYNFLEIATIAYAGNGISLWTNHIANAEAAGIVADGAGNVFVSGREYDDNSYIDYLTIAYSKNGVPLWTNSYSSPGLWGDLVNGMAISTNGNVYVTGSSGSNYDTATIAYSGAGSPLWTNYVEGGGGIVAMAAGGSGNVFVTSTSSQYDFLTVAYSEHGIPLWTNRYGATMGSYEYANAIAADQNNVYVTGDTSGSRFATVAYSATGTPLWTNFYGPGQSRAVAADKTGNVYVTGSDGDYVTIAYSGNGLPLWTNRYGGLGDSSDQSQAVVVDQFGTVVVTGSQAASGSQDIVTVAYSSYGMPLWTNRYDGPVHGSDGVGPNSLAVGLSGNVIVAGWSDGDASSAMTPDWVVTQYSSFPAIQISDMDILTNGGIRFTVNAFPNVVYRLDASTNFVDWQNLTQTSNAPLSVKQFIDASALPRRFYRATWVP